MTKCTIDGVEYDEIPEFKGEPAFWGDGGPNPQFDWDGWRRQIKAMFDEAHAAGELIRRNT